MTDPEIAQEAERLVNLDKKRLDIELISTALRLGRQSDDSFEELQQLDRECLDALVE